MNTNSQNNIDIPFDATYNQRKALVIEIETASWHARLALKQKDSLKAQKYTLQVIALKQQLENLKKGKKHG